MLTMSYHIVGSDAGCMRCLITVNPTLGANSLSQVLFLFLTFIPRNLLVYWAQGIKDTDTLDAGRGDYLFGSSNVQIQQSQQGLRTLSHIPIGK